MELKMKIFRFDPRKDEQPRYQTFAVDAQPTDRLLDCLNRIRWEQDPTLSFRMSCAHGVCGSDGMRINGICGLPCQKLVKDFKEEVLLEPMPVFRSLDFARVGWTDGGDTVRPHDARFQKIDISPKLQL